jgi:hypothetical protein
VETLIFLMFIGICALVLIFLVIKSSKQKPKRSRLGNNRNIWGKRRQHGHAHKTLLEDRGKGSSYQVSANKIDFDQESAADDEPVGGTLSEVEFTPQEASLGKTSSSK